MRAKNEVTTSTLEAVLKRDRAIVVSGLVLVVSMSWLYIIAGAGMGMNAVEMTAMSSAAGDGMATGPMGGDGTDEATNPMPSGMGDAASTVVGMAMQAMMPVEWTPTYATLMFFMWWIMMIAMMLPSATPMILLFAAVNRKKRHKGDTFVPTGIFASGYIIVWGLFSVAAVTLQWGFERSGLMSSMMMETTSLAVGGTLLVAAGLWQLTPLKHACLKHCRSPIQFVLNYWQQGKLGALRMGVRHGAFCLACCWFLMGLLFYGGVMNLYWIVGLAVFVLLEKTIPAGHWLGYVSGAGLLIWGALLLANAIA